MLWPAPERNKIPIADILADVLPPSGLVLEIGSGTGQHVAWFADRFTHLEWQPSSIAPQERSSIIEHTRPLTNVRPVMSLEASEAWNITADAVLCLNMIHIAPWEATCGLMRNAAAALSQGGLLFLYGPFRVDGMLTPESNVRFDRELKAKDPRFGIRDVEDVTREAAGFRLETLIPMPANNYSVVFRRSGSSVQSGST